ncbi:putative alcohol dehydrogenase [Apostichopus japonicus]|uniref:Putative alcohol dehydrogenase n=1 Tax=Stichopus japonicus TaxID=307972 RepID=A0A2G8L5Y6_STIJA|nr:putative alcohol dehydrogenase [Apostichopus japonicus]
MADKNTFVSLGNGQTIPILGLGTWNSEKNKVKEAVIAAIDAGYRHLDCAWAYSNEIEVGEALKEKFTDGTVKREDLWNSFHAPEDVQRNLEDTLKKLQLSYLDLYLMHWPTAFQAGENPFPTNADGGFIPGPTDYTVTWQDITVSCSGSITNVTCILRLRRHAVEVEGTGCIIVGHDAKSSERQNGHEMKSVLELVLRTWTGSPKTIYWNRDRGK